MPDYTERQVEIVASAIQAGRYSGKHFPATNPRDFADARRALDALFADWPREWRAVSDELGIEGLVTDEETARVIAGWDAWGAVESRPIVSKWVREEL